MGRSYAKFKIGRRRRERNCNSSSYEKMMKTLLLQNQQIIIQQQNMMFLVMKQLQHPPQHSHSSAPMSDEQHQQLHHNAAQQHHQPQQHQQSQQQTPINHNHHQQQHQQQQQQQTPHNLQQIQQQQTQYQIHKDPTLNSHQLFSQANNASSLDTQHQLQQVASQLQENLGSYLTPAASEQDPINDKQGEDDLVALIESDGLLHNNLLYNPQTDIGSITPYKSQQQQQQTPSYYSSGCESLSTPRVDQQRQPTTTNISQTVVKNLADSFKSPSKPKINVQILSGSATGSMKNSKAKIIQRMNISEFLRHVHPENDESQKSNSSQ